MRPEDVGSPRDDEATMDPAPIRSRVRPHLALGLSLLLAVSPASGRAVEGRPVPADLTGYDPSCGVIVRADGPGEGGRVRVEWPMAEGETGRLVLDARDGEPLIESLEIDGAGAPLLKDV